MLTEIAKGLMLATFAREPEAQRSERGHVLPRDLPRLGFVRCDEPFVRREDGCC